MLNSSVSSRALQEANIARSYLDRGTLFAGDTQSVKVVDTQKYGEDSVGSSTVSKVKIIISSHAGAHADNPLHFQSKPPFKKYPDDSYTGPALVLDVSRTLCCNFEINRSMIENALDELGRPETDRLLIRTNRHPTYPDMPREMFPYFGLDAGHFFAELNLKLVGIDTPSVDHPKKPDICNGVHGILLKSNTAIIENINLSRYSTSKKILITIFDPDRDFPDARGISAAFLLEDESRKH